MDELIEMLRTIYRVQYQSDIDGAAEGALWYYQHRLEEILGVSLFEIPAGE